MRHMIPALAQRICKVMYRDVALVKKMVIILHDLLQRLGMIRRKDKQFRVVIIMYWQCSLRLTASGSSGFKDHLCGQHRLYC